jgi:hypothetical protein
LVAKVILFFWVNRVLKIIFEYIMKFEAIRMFNFDWSDIYDLVITLGWSVIDMVRITLG